MKVSELTTTFTGDRIDFKKEDETLICTCPAGSYILEVLKDMEILSWSTISTSRKHGICIIVKIEEEVTDDGRTETP